MFSFGVLVLVIISGRKNTILDKRGDTVGDLVRDVSELNTYSNKILVIRMIICYCLGHIIDYKFGFALYFSHVMFTGKLFQAWHMWKDQRLCELVDPSLGNGYEITEITRCAQVALLCAQEDPADRPTMIDVAAMLNSESMSLPMQPKQPTALSEVSAGEDATSTYMGQTSRTIDITITSSAPMSTRVRIILDPEV